MKKKLCVLLLVLTGIAQGLDQKSLLVGVAIGLGVYTVQHGVVPTASTIWKATTKVGKKTAKGVKRAVLGPKKKLGVEGADARAKQTTEPTGDSGPR